MSETPAMAKLEILKGPDEALEVGGLRFVACRREVDRFDGGVTLYVFGDEGGQSVELLRFDFFRNRPHYHAPADEQAETTIDAAGHSSIEWGVQALTTRAPEFVRQAGQDGIADALDTQALAESAPQLESLFAGLEEPTEVSYFEIPQSVFDGLAAGTDAA